MANKAATEPCVCIIRDDRLVQTCSAHDAAIKNAQSAESRQLKATLLEIMELQRNHRKSRPSNDYGSGFLDGLSIASDVAHRAIKSMERGQADDGGQSRVSGPRQNDGQG